jgi:hypothetical protein
MLLTLSNYDLFHLPIPPRWVGHPQQQKMDDGQVGLGQFAGDHHGVPDARNNNINIKEYNEALIDRPSE